MSRLHKAVLGLPQGTLGQLVFRIRKGAAFICTRPIPFMPGTEPDDMARRARFGLTCRFSKQVNSIVQLKKLWGSANAKGSAYNTIASKNYGAVSDTIVTAAAEITPEGGLGIPITSAVVTNASVQIEVDSLLTDKIDPLVETKVRLVSVLYLSGPKAETTLAHGFLPIVSAAQAFDVEVPTIFNVNLDSQDTLVFDLYNAHKLFYAIVTEDAQGKVYHYSKTCTV